MTTQQPHPEPVAATTGNSAAAWQQLNSRALTPDEQACLDAAARQADRALIVLAEDQPGHDPHLHRGAGWHRLALSTYQLLCDSHAYGHLAGQTHMTCVVHEPILRAWLTGTSIEPDTQGRRIADLLHVDDAFTTVNDTTRADFLATLLRSAQEYNAFGVDGHTIGLVRESGGDGTERLRLVVDPPHGPALASAPLGPAELLGPEPSGVDGAVAAIVVIAGRVNDLFAEHAHAAWTHPSPAPRPDLPRRARPFPALDPAARALLTQPPPQPTPPTPSRKHR